MASQNQMHRPCRRSDMRHEDRDPNKWTDMNHSQKASFLLSPLAPRTGLAYWEAQSPRGRPGCAMCQEDVNDYVFSRVVAHAPCGRLVCQKHWFWQGDLHT